MDLLGHKMEFVKDSWYILAKCSARKQQVSLTNHHLSGLCRWFLREMNQVFSFFFFLIFTSLMNKTWMCISLINRDEKSFLRSSHYFAFSQLRFYCICLFFKPFNELKIEHCLLLCLG